MVQSMTHVSVAATREARSGQVSAERSPPCSATGCSRALRIDTHFSAYGVDAVLLWNGCDNVNWPSSDSLDEVYLGANNPSVSFDNSHARFTV